MKKIGLSILLIISFLNSGLAMNSKKDRPSIEKISAVSRKAEVADGQSDMPAVVDWRWIGVKSSQIDTCPELPSWRSSFLFKAPKRDIRQSTSSYLRRYCLYESFDKEPKLDEIKRLSRLGIEKISRDKFVLSNMATNLANESQEALQKNLFKQIDFQEYSPVGMESPRTRLSILDTLPTHAGNPELLETNSIHGLTLANIAKRLICDEEGEHCSVNLVSHLALPLVQYESSNVVDSYLDEVKGGYTGSLSYLAQSIFQAVNQWQWESNEPNLVINLSLGWDGTKWGGVNPDESMEPDVENVYDAIRYAVCSGVLVVSSSGNFAGGLDRNNGALLPARWEELPLPSAKECRIITGGNPKNIYPSNNKVDYAPLVFAVGGVAHGNNRLVNARKNAEPRQVAYGDHAVVINPNLERPLSALTGSSVSSALVSTVASLVWSHKPNLKPYQVMQLIYSKSYGLDRYAEMCNTNGNVKPCKKLKKFQTRRLSYCRVISRVCPECTDSSQCHFEKKAADVSGVAFSGFYTPSAIELNPTNYSMTLAAPRECELPEYWYNPSDPLLTLDCPKFQMTNQIENPWTFPQPDEIICPYCTLKKETSVAVRSGSSTTNQYSYYSLFLEISSAYAGHLIENPVLVIDHIGIHLNDLPQLTGGDSVVIRNILLPEVAQAGISFVVNGVVSNTSPILVAREE